MYMYKFRLLKREIFYISLSKMLFGPSRGILDQEESTGWVRNLPCNPWRVFCNIKIFIVYFTDRETRQTHEIFKESDDC